MKKETSRNVCTFQSTREIECRLAKLKAERGVDKTSLIKLGLYMVCSLLSRYDVRHMTLDEVVASIEARAPKRFPSFCTFSTAIRPAHQPFNPPRRRRKPPRKD